MNQTRIHTKVFDFVIFSNLFIACCAVLMAWFSTHIFNIPTSRLFLGFVFFSTLASYSIHWYLTDADKEITAQRTSWLSANKKVHLIFFLLSAVGSVVFLFLELKNFKWLIPAVLLTLMYSAPKIPLAFFDKLKPHIWGKTILLATMWTYVTAALPLLVQEQQWLTQHWLFFFNRLTLIFAICILFDLRDREFDKSTGVKTLITLLDHKKVKNIFTVIIACSLIASGLLYIFLKDLLIVAILAVPAFLTYFLYLRANKTSDDYLFYFILDGLMALSPILYFAKNLINSLYNM